MNLEDMATEVAEETLREMKAEGADDAKARPPLNIYGDKSPNDEVMKTLQYSLGYEGIKIGAVQAEIDQYGAAPNIVYLSNRPLEGMAAIPLASFGILGGDDPVTVETAPSEPDESDASLSSAELALKIARDAAQKALSAVPMGCGGDGVVIVRSPGSRTESGGAMVVAWTGTGYEAATALKGLAIALGPEFEGAF